MIQGSTFPDLTNVFDRIRNSDPNSSSEDEGDEEEEDEKEAARQLLGVKGEAKVAILTKEVLQGIER